MNTPSVFRDERTTAIEDASYRIAYLVVSYGLLVVVAYRGFVFQESNWDLLALVILSGIIATIYQGAKKVLSRRWLIFSGVVFIVSAILAAALVVILR